MSDKITVNVDDLRAHVTFTDGDRREAGRRLRAALAEHDKAEQERLDTLVFASEEDMPVHTELVRFVGYGFYEVDAYYVESLGEFYPHQTDHAYQAQPADDVLCCECSCPEWAHTPAVPDWQTDETVEFVEGTYGAIWRRRGDKWAYSDIALWTWQDLVKQRGPITPVGWRRDPDNITIPKSALHDQPPGWWRNQAVGTFFPKTLRQLFNAVADALEADHA